MLELYPQIRLLHIVLVSVSGSLFALRGLCSLAGMRWPHWGAVRWLSIINDTLLLTAAAMLYTMLPKAMFGNGWLALKLVLVVLYIALGFMALRTARPRRVRVAFYLAALATFALVVGIARLHSPWGWLLPVVT